MDLYQFKAFNKFSKDTQKAILQITQNGHPRTLKLRNALLNAENDQHAWDIIRNPVLTNTHRDLLKQWSPKNTINPFEVTYSSREKVLWVCDKGHEWFAQIESRTHYVTSCKVCINQVTCIGFNDIQTTHPDVAKEYHPSNKRPIEDVRYTLCETALWECSEGHQWEQSIAYRCKSNSKCPKCYPVSQIELRLIETLGFKKKRLNIRFGKSLSMEVDGVHPEKKIVVEYDGGLWHKNRKDIDIRKSQLILDNGYTLIRIRETPLYSLGIKHPKYHEIKYKHSLIDKNIHDLAKNIKSLVTNTTP